MQVFSWKITGSQAKQNPLVSQGVLASRFTNLLVDLGDGTGTYGAATLTDREA